MIYDLLRMIYGNDETRRWLWHLLDVYQFDPLMRAIVEWFGYVVFDDWSIGK